MLAALIIVFREVMEAALVVGIVAAVTNGVKGARRAIAGGIAAGVSGAVLLAVFAGTIAAAVAGMGQEIFNASVLGLAVVMLAWHNIWMASHGREMIAELREAGNAVRSGSATLLSLALVVTVAVLREGSEIVLFLYGIAAQGGETVVGMVSGGVLGLVAGVALGWLSFAGLVRISPRYIFSVTGWLITLLAAGMAASATAFLEQAGIITILPETVWDSSAILPEASLFGRLLHVLIGYSEAPTGIDLVVWLATIAVIWSAAHVVNARTRAPAQPLAAK